MVQSKLKLPYPTLTYNAPILCSYNVESADKSNSLEFSIDEIIHATKQLKSNKSCGIDSISNEMFKNVPPVFLEIIRSAFNDILCKGIYPKMWNTAIITPIHKCGDKADTNNYRGISISSCFSKLFNLMINKRVQHFLTCNDIIVKNQCGFRNDHRTEDNLFIINTIHQKYVHKEGKRLYMAFVDFRKYFDTINRELLLYRLIACGITGKIYHTLKHMYADRKYHVRINNGLSKSFSSNCGVIQGCNLSPTLANLFQNNLHDIFGSECDQICLDGQSFSSLSFADDLVLISTSANGLQVCLNKLENYCKRWRLSVNVKKTKIMTMSKRNYIAKENFHMLNYCLEKVNTYKYLGLIISSDGKFKTCVSDRINKAKRAMFIILQALMVSGCVSPRLNMTVFDKQIIPILLYGCPIWGSYNKVDIHYDKHLFERVQTDFCKRTLNITKRCSNVIARGEFGRYPLSNIIYSRMIKYWCRLESGTKNMMLNAAYKESKIVGTDWINKISSLLCRNGYAIVFENPQSVNLNIFSKYFQQRVNDQYEQYYQSYIKESPRFDIVKLVFKKYKFCNYLDVIKSSKIRCIFSRLRTDNSLLEVTRGRFRNVPREDRLCICKKSVEDPIHFILHCERYKDYRDLFIKNMTNLNMKIEKNYPNKIIQLLFNFEVNAEVSRHCVNFVKDIYASRSEV